MLHECTTFFKTTITTPKPKMEGTSREIAADTLSWNEVKEISKELEQLFRQDAKKDAERLRFALQKKSEIAVSCQEKQAEARQKLKHLLMRVKESEQQEAAARAKEEELRQKIQELNTIKADITVQLERFRLDEQSAQLAIEDLLNKYETTRMEVMQYHMEHQNDIPLAKHSMSLYASITGIKWDFNSLNLSGEIIAPHAKSLTHFEVDPNLNPYDTANELWNKIDQAFDEIDQL